MMSAFKDIRKEDWDALLEGIVNREYHLLLGAGINSDALGGDRKPIPNANTLVDELVTDFNLQTGGESLDLKRAYENIERRSDRTGRNREQYFRYRFSNCAASWQDLIFHVSWRRIWTLNIDDVLENAFSKFVAKQEQPPKLHTCIWSDPFVELGRERDNIQIVHLHGNSQRGKLIFSILEYLNAITTKTSWHPVFGDEYLQEPFIIIGTKLREEFDLHEFINRGNNSKRLLGKPSFIILNEITAIQRDECIRWGLIPIEGEAKTFIEQLIPDVSNLEIKMAETLVPGGDTSLSPYARTFLQQFRNLTVNKEEQIVPFEHDFYNGDEPIWADILNNFDVRLESTDNIYEDLKPILDNTEQCAYFIPGDPGSGKSTALLRIARDLIALGKTVFMFRAEERLDIEAVVWWLKRAQNIVLVFDNVADFMDEVADLCEACREEKVKLFMVSAERTRREGIIVDELEHVFLHKYNKARLGHLSDLDIEILVKKLAQLGRLGKLTQKNVADRRYYFRKTVKRHLFAAMADLEGGTGYIDRIKKEYEYDIKSPILKDVYALACISHDLGYSLPINIIASATSLPINNIMREVSSSNGQLFKIIVIDSKGLRARHRLIASRIVQNVLTSEKRYELIKALAIHLSPHISPTAIHQKTLYYRIIRELMDERIIRDRLGNTATHQFYSDLLPYYDWDARYWEQRALAEANMDHLPQARSFAETAVSRNRDPFTLNTLGLILLRLATDSSQKGPGETLGLYWEGIKNLRESLAKGENRFPHPFRTFFTHTLHYVSLYFKTEPIDRNIVKEWNWWFGQAKNNRIFSSPDAYPQLNEYQVQWLKYAVQRP